MPNPAAPRMWNSIRTRFVLGILVIVIPAAILMYSASTAVRSNLVTLTHIIDAPLEELVTTKQIQNAIFRSELPFYLYMNRGEAADRESFIRLTVDIDLKFETLAINMASIAADKKILSTAQAEWQAAKSLGESLLSTTDIPDNKVLMAKIDQFSRHLERAASMLEAFSERALTEIDNQRLIAQKNEWKTLNSLALAFSLGLIIALFAAFSLSQTVIKPIRRLEETMNRFGQGDTSRRSNVNSKDELGSLASAFNQLAEQYEQIQQELDYLSVHDNLTGLFDQCKLLAEMRMEIERAKRYNRPFSILLLDINDFHEVNRQYGRLVGDSVLCSVADRIRATIRPTDIACRYGDDEFAIILSETNATGALEFAQRIEQAIEKKPINIGDGKKRDISIAISYATYPADADDESSLLAAAERLLTQSKKIPMHLEYKA